MESADDFLGLPLQDRITHKNWKARHGAYEELAKLFKTFDETDTESYKKYSECIRKSVIDANAVAQEAGLNALLSFVEYAPASISSRLRKDVVSNIIEKCLGSSRSGTREKSIDVLLMFIETDVSDHVIDDVINGLSHKTPKVVAACVSFLREAVFAFGIIVINPKIILKQLAKIFDHKDKTVRNEGTNLALELYRWIGAAISNSLSDLKPVQLKDLNEEFENMQKEKSSPIRFLRSDKTSRIKERAGDSAEQAEQSVEQTEDLDAEAEAPQFDAAEFIDPVNILDNLPKNFYDNLLSSKWKERKEALDALLALVKSPKLEDGRYSELVSALAKRIQDANVVVVILAAQCIDALACGLRTAFSTYHSIVIGSLLERCKEKKTNVLEALRSALDHVFATMGTISDVTDEIVATMTHKNPQIKLEGVQFLTRCLKITEKVPAKQEIKALAEGLSKIIDDADAGVRDASAEAMGTLMKLVGERPMAAFIDKLDSVRCTKVREYFATAQIKMNAGGKAKVVTKSTDDGKENTAPVSQRAPVKKSKSSTSMSRPRPGSAILNKKPATAKVESSKILAPKKEDDFVYSYRFSDSSGETYLIDTVGEELVNALTDPSWKIRLSGIQSIADKLSAKSFDVEAEAIFWALFKKPGFQESNFQVLNAVVNIFTEVAMKSSTFCKAAASIIVPGLVDKLGDIKIKKSAGECLVALSEGTSLGFILSLVYEPLKKQKSPKILADALIWISQALTEFGISGIVVKDLVEFIKSNLGNTNQAVRSNAVSLLGQVRVYLGANVRNFVSDLSPALLSVIDAEFERVSSDVAPDPSRTQKTMKATITKPNTKNSEVSKTESQITLAAEEEASNDKFPRVDISSSLNDISANLMDANWKIRKEGLDQVIATLDGANNCIKSNLGGDFIPALKARFNDSNKNLMIQALEITGKLAQAIGKPFDKYFRILGPLIVGCLSDQKPQVRSAAVSSLDTVCKMTGIDCMFNTISTSLLPEHSILRKDLLQWMGKALEDNYGPVDDIPRKKIVDMDLLVQPLVTCLLDKTADVRKASQICLRFVVQSYGYDFVRSRASELFKGSQLQSVLTIIDTLKSTTKAQGPAPITPVKPKKIAPKISESDPPVKSSSTLTARSSDVKTKASSSKATLARKDSVELVRSAHEAPLLSGDTRDKIQRAEKNIGLTKWVFEAPRKDLTEFLQDQCVSNLSSELISLLFSDDHYKEKYFLQGLAMLDDALSSEKFCSDNFAIELVALRPRYIANADLILKYLTIRLADTNTTMIIKCLDLIEHLFAAMDDEGYTMSEYEASVFLPYFINKTGDSKEMLRLKIKGILKQLCRVYPASKLFGYVLEGIKSKNARVRAECLDELASLIQRYGVSVCAQPLKVFPSIAAQISDRDAPVRNAAMLVITQTYQVVGDAVYKYIGKLQDKERSLLEEKIRRLPSSSSLASIASVKDVQVDSPKIRSNVFTEPAKELEDVKPLIFSKASSSTQEFSLDLDQLGIPSTIQPTRDISLPSTPDMYLSKPLTTKMVETASRDEIVLEHLLSCLTTNDFEENMSAIKTLEKMISEDPIPLAAIAEDIISSTVSQIKSVCTSGSIINANSNKLCRHLLHLIASVFGCPVLTSKIKRNVLYLASAEFLSRMHDPVLNEIDKFSSNPNHPTLSKNMSSVMIRIIETANKNLILSVVLELLEKSVLESKTVTPEKYNYFSKYMDLVMRCLWKITKLIPSLVKQPEFIAADLISDFHNLLTSIPPVEWKKLGSESPMQQVDLAFKTVKTMLLEFVSCYKEGIFDHISRIPEPSSSHAINMIRAMVDNERKKHGLSAYEDSRFSWITPAVSKPRPMSTMTVNRDSPQAKLLASVAKKGVYDSPLRRQLSTPELSQTKISHGDAELNEELTLIFQKISNKDITKEGIQELYDFKKVHHYAEPLVEAHLAKTGQYFQGYIRRGLANLMAEEHALKSKFKNNVPEIPNNVEANPYQEKLLKLRRMFDNNDGQTTTDPSAEGMGGLVGTVNEVSETVDDSKTKEEERNLGRTQTVAELRERLTRMKKTLGK